MAKILVIEDSSFQRKILSEMLTESGFEVFLTENGRQGIERTEQLKPDLIITDLLMPDGDGFQVLEALRTKKLNIPAIILTSDIQKTTARRCRDLGACAVLNKPVNKEQIISAVRDAIRVP
ncbi:MAG: response regulator [Methanoregula sp.]|jgi:twitching motility two-component system response regulator PilH|uniref:response regulator n=1 Tax=Methanoregula sp. TaxID=2052170 RepID=UPI003C152FDE